MDVVAGFPADGQPPEPVQQGDSVLYGPALRAQARVMFGAMAGDHGGVLGLPLAGVNRASAHANRVAGWRR